MYRKMIWFGCVVLLSLSMIACSEKKEAADTNAVPLQMYKQKITSANPPQTLKVNEKVTMQVTVTNIGNEPWRMLASDVKGSNMVTLGFQWLDSTGAQIQNGRAMLSQDLMPKSSVTLEVNAQAPSKPGDYSLRFSMVQEAVAWFYEKDAESLVFKVQVK